MVFYLVGLTFCAGYAIIQAADFPMVSVNEIRQTWFRVYLALLLFCLVAALLYLFYLYFEICRRRPFRPHRHNVFMTVSLVFTTTVLTLTLMGGFDLTNFSAGLLLFFFAFSNFYTYFLQYLYSPTQEQLHAFRNPDGPSQNQTDMLSEAKTINI